MTRVSNLAPPWNLILTLPTEAAQLMLLTSGRPVLSLLTARLCEMDRSFMPTSKEPLFLLFKESKRHCRGNPVKWIHLERIKGKSYLHPSEELDPPVSTQVYESIVYGEFDSTSRHQLNWSDRQSNIHYLYTKIKDICQDTLRKVPIQQLKSLLYK